MEITFPGGLRVDVKDGQHTISTDQPQEAGGSGLAPSPFELFLASIGACAGYYVLKFCLGRKIPAEGISLALDTERNVDDGMVKTVRVNIRVPEGFPKQYREALVRAAQSCSVKKHIQQPPEFDITVTG
jgi:putative redox protein